MQLFLHSISFNFFNYINISIKDIIISIISIKDISNVLDLIRFLIFLEKEFFLQEILFSIFNIYNDFKYLISIYFCDLYILYWQVFQCL